MTPPARGRDRDGAPAARRAIADASINLRGLSAAVLGSRFVDYMAFDSAEDADPIESRASAGSSVAPVVRKPHGNGRVWVSAVDHAGRLLFRRRRIHLGQLGLSPGQDFVHPLTIALDDFEGFTKSILEILGPLPLGHLQLHELSELPRVHEEDA
jgi:hypothetical protein